MTVRAKIVGYCDWAVLNADAIHYAQIRPMPAVPRKLPLTTDCSGFVTLAYRYAGAPDPNGLGYNGYGYTGTLLDHGRKVSSPQPGDLIIFGNPPGRHVTVYLYTWHGAWVTCSHGFEGGPILILNHREYLAQRVGFQVRRYLPDMTADEQAKP